ncbi:hypothetical protein HK18_05315 [Commensalibacter intestini]|uniref:Uncharacterized protein n=1 Tax=Commensalibacter intestini TaxID=479936 RepID=A0A251ZVX9_9PROT|nr:hypothetical protein HK18_05315 [Commensalibacter intestini]
MQEKNNKILKKIFLFLFLHDLIDIMFLNSSKFDVLNTMFISLLNKNLVSFKPILLIFIQDIIQQ